MTNETGATMKKKTHLLTKALTFNQIRSYLERLNFGGIDPKRRSWQDTQFSLFEMVED